MDLDSYGDANVSIQTACSLDSLSTNNRDCDDTSSMVYTSAFEVCDGLYNDCDPLNGNMGYLPPEEADLDGDSVPDCDSTLPEEHDGDRDGFSETDGDCDDADPYTYGCR